jgi:RNA polymerase sigma factor (TIGR02999 family)
MENISAPAPRAAAPAAFLTDGHAFPENEDAQITSLITGWRSGDRAAENRIFESLYHALRGQALRCLRRESDGHSLSPTLLVNEAYLVLARARQLNVNDRDHFLRIAARIMTNLLIDRARGRKAISNGGGMRQVEWEHSEWEEGLVRTDEDADRVLAVAEALEILAARSPELARLVQLRFFCGFTELETAQIEGRPERTIRRQWAVARTRLMESLHGVQ